VTLTATRRHPASLRPSHHIRVVSFGRFDATLCRVEKASALTLPDLVRYRNPRSNTATSLPPPSGGPLLLVRQHRAAAASDVIQNLFGISRAPTTA
jgi:hypothetical protein